MKLGNSSIPPATALWALAATVALGGGAAVGQTLEPQIASERATRYDAQRRLESDNAVLARADALIAQRNRDRALLHGIDVDDDGATIVARFVNDVARLAAATHVTVTQLGSADKGSGATAAGTVTPPPSTTLNISATPAPRSAKFSAMRLAVKLDGRYRDLLSAIRAFSALGVLAELDVAGLERARGDRLTASLNVVLYRRPAAGDSATPKRVQPNAITGPA